MIRNLTQEEIDEEKYIAKTFECSWCAEYGECGNVHRAEDIAGYDEELGGPVCRDCVKSAEVPADD